MEVDEDTIEYNKMKYENASVRYQNVLEVEEMVNPNQSFKCQNSMYECVGN